jgi:hypothetical protein
MTGTMAETREAEVKVGQVYEGWGKRWKVTRVWGTERVAEIVNVGEPMETARLPLIQFHELTVSREEA